MTLGLKYAHPAHERPLPADVLGVSVFDERTQSFRFHADRFIRSS
jgi:hypothetical protein